MSTTRMCDSIPFCVNDPSGMEPWRRIFSEAAPGWSTGSVTVNRKDEKTGRMIAQELDQDKCPDCTNAQLGITPTIADPQQARDARLSPQYVDWLERQCEVGKYKPITNGEPPPTQPR